MIKGAYVELRDYTFLTNAPPLRDDVVQVTTTFSPQPDISIYTHGELEASDGAYFQLPLNRA